MKNFIFVQCLYRKNILRHVVNLSEYIVKQYLSFLEAAFSVIVFSAIATFSF